MIGRVFDFSVALLIGWCPDFMTIEQSTVVEYDSLDMIFDTPVSRLIFMTFLPVLYLLIVLLHIVMVGSTLIFFVGGTGKA